MRTLQAMTVTLLVAALLPLTTPTALGAVPGDRLVYTHADAEESQLRVVDAVSGAETALTSGHFDVQPSWSPAADQVAFVRRDGLSDEVMVVADDGGSLRAVAPGSDDVAWSPDGAWLAFTRRAREGADRSDDGVWLARPDGSGLRRLAAGGALPVWSPDGSTIVFARGRTLNRVGVDAGAEVTLAELPFSPASIDWSPDGGALAVAGFPDSDDSGVWVLEADGSGLRRLTDAAVGTAARPVWSPDAARLAFAAFRDGQADVWVVGADGAGLRALTAGGADDVFPDWSPDGTRLAFIRHADITSPSQPNDVWLIDVDGGTPRQLTAGGRAGPAVFAPGAAVRVAGADRVATAVALSRRSVAAAGAVVIARADAYADALAAGPLAARVGGPLLLTPSQRLDPAVAAEITRLGATTAYLVGGSQALSEQIVADLHAVGADVVRLGGVSRFDTAGRVAERLGAASAYIVEGANSDPARGWPDAVSVSALAAFQQRPILLVERDRLPTETRPALQFLHAGVTIVGGHQAVSPAVADELTALGLNVTRVAGATRYDTSRLIAEAGLEAGMGQATTWLASGRNWPDALAAGPAAAAGAETLVLVDGQTPAGGPEALAWIGAERALLERLLLIGGPAAITPAVQVALLRAAGPPPPCPNQDLVVADPERRQAGTLTGDVDGDGSPDGVSLAVDESGPEGCQAFLIVDAASARHATPTGWFDRAGGALPRLHGLVPIDDRPGHEVLVDLAAGAATEFLGAFTMGDASLRRMTIHGADRYGDLFAYGGSVGHQDAVDCTADGGVVIAAAVLDDDRYRVTRHFYRLQGAALVLDHTRTEHEDVPLDSDEPTLPPPFGTAPFGSCR